LQKKSEIHVLLVIVFTGIASVVTQLLSVRELLAQFSGNEFVIAMILTIWLILGGVGTLLARWFSDRWPASCSGLGRLTLILAACSPLLILAIRALRDLFFLPGSGAGFTPTLLFTLGTVSPYALLVGFALPYSLYAIRGLSPAYPGTRAYLADNLGDVTGGVLFSFVIVFVLLPFQALLVLNSALVVLALPLFPRQKRRSVPVLLGCAAALASGLLGLGMETRSLSTGEGELVAYEESRYGRIQVLKSRRQVTLILDGEPVTSSQNSYLAQELAHIPLAQRRGMDRILLIGAQAGMMHEIAKHDPDRVDYLEIDPRLTDLQFRFRLLERIPGLNVVHRDGRAYLQERSDTFDALLISLPEPETFKTNRFFTRDFFNLARDRLRSGGVLCFSVQSPGNYIGGPELKKISSLHNTAREVFEHVLLLPGQRLFFLCSSEPLNADIPARLAARGIQADYIQNWFPGEVTPDRIEQVNQAVNPDVPANLDVSPSLMRIMFSQWFTMFSSSPLVFSLILAGLMLAYLLRVSLEEFVLFSTGFITMGTEILVIFTVQIFFGYVYTLIGIIVTVFLAGLFPGALLGDRLRSRGRVLLSVTDGLLIILLCGYILTVHAGGGALPVSVYLIFGFAVALCCGFQFPVALHVRGGGNRAVAGTFSADLIGAALGTLVTSVGGIPMAGLAWTAAGLIGLKTLSLAALRIKT
jgi:spermidine synthase